MAILIKGEIILTSKKNKSEIIIIVPDMLIECFFTNGKSPLKTDFGHVFEVNIDACNIQWLLYKDSPDGDIKREEMKILRNKDYTLDGKIEFKIDHEDCYQ